MSKTESSAMATWMSSKVKYILGLGVILPPGYLLIWLFIKEGVRQDSKYSAIEEGK